MCKDQTRLHCRHRRDRIASVLAEYAGDRTGEPVDEEISSRRILKRGLRVMGKMSRLEPGVFTIGAVGAVVHSVATLAGAFISGAIVDRVIPPSIADGEPAVAGMAIAVVALVALTLVKIGEIGRASCR